MSCGNLRLLRLVSHLALATLAFAFMAAARPAQAQIYTDLHDFNPATGEPSNFDSGRLAQGRDGNFYAESANGGTASNGTVFNLTLSNPDAISVLQENLQ